MSRLKCRDQNCTTCSRCRLTRDLSNGRISSLFLYLELLAMNPSTLLAILQIFSVCSFHLRSLVMMIPRSSCWSVVGTVDWICYSCFACCCVRGALQNIILWTLKLICHLLANSTSLLISSSSAIMPSRFLALWQSLVSSENVDNLLTILISRSFIYIRNSSGPNTPPCGPPDVTGAQLL